MPCDYQGAWFGAREGKSTIPNSRFGNELAATFCIQKRIYEILICVPLCQ